MKRAMALVFVDADLSFEAPISPASAVDIGLL